MSAKGIWFLNTLVYVRVGQADGEDGLSVLEHRAPPGDSPPLHLHRTEDEVFHILEGEFLFQISDETRRCGPGTVLLAPKGVAHTYRVESPEGGHFLTVTARGDFERFVRAAGREAAHDALPPRAGPPSAGAAEALAAVARTYGIELVGPPL
jgi:quercetin dioxygenase-like cupin family protein